MSLVATLAATLLTTPVVAGAGPNVIDQESGPGTQAVGNPVIEVLTFNTPHEVKQIRSTSSGSFIQVSLQDCCIAGDQWVQRTHCLQNGAIWDSRAKALGNITSFTALTTAYKNGTQAMDCITEVRYGEGVAVFPAGMSVKFGTSAGFNVTTTIQATLVPLPSQ
jgi:hypothetical protein